MSHVGVTYGQVLRALCDFAPLDLQESYDNSGLQVGDPNKEVEGVVCCLDVTEAVLREAVELRCNLVVSHHPLIFRPLRSLKGDDRVSRMILYALQHGVGVLSMHTNLDSAPYGVSYALGRELGLVGMRVLSMREGLYTKLVTFAPTSHADEVRRALFASGAGVIGKYSDCSFNTRGWGTFTTPVDGQPFLGVAGESTHVEEVRIEVIVRSSLLDGVLARLRDAHPYEEPAYDLMPLSGGDTHSGLGVVGELKVAFSTRDFLLHVRDCLGVSVIRHSVSGDARIQRVAVCGGSGASLIGAARRAGADAYVTADLKYHDFQEGYTGFLLVDAGHGETERVAVDLLYGCLKGKFTTFAVHRSQAEHSPVCYDY